MDYNPADLLDDPVWKMFKTFGQKENIPALKGYVYDLIQLATQKTAGIHKKKDELSFDDDFYMTINGVLIEATALVLSGRLDELEKSEAKNKESDE